MRVVTDTGAELQLTPKRLIVAGYTGRNEAAVAAHIAELADLGVPPPASVPTFFDLDTALLTVDDVVTVDAETTSGEVEPVVIRQDGRHYLTVGSDHTDRELEKTDIDRSKASCPKPIGRTVVELTDAVDWDTVQASCTVDGAGYQEGTLAELRTPSDVLAKLADALPDTAGDLVMFGGTLPLLNGKFVFGRSWRMQLTLPDGRSLTHTYETRSR